ncbi:MAG: DUF1634 domain-containing protein [Desulfohalobiaceae bacterium]
MRDQRSKYVAPEQQLYAEMLEKGMYLGLGLLLLTFMIYAFGIIEPYIALDKIANYWHTSAAEYLHSADIPDGWGWIALLGYSDILNFIGIALLAAVTIFCYISIIPLLIKQKDMLYAFFVALEALILIFAASGILKVGGH